MDKKRNRKDSCDTLKTGEPAVGYESTVMSPLEKRNHQRKMKSGNEVYRLMEKLRGFLNLKTGRDGYQALPVNHHVVGNRLFLLTGRAELDLMQGGIGPAMKEKHKEQNIDESTFTRAWREMR